MDCAPGVACTPDEEPFTQLVNLAPNCQNAALMGGPGLANRVIRRAYSNDLTWVGPELVPPPAVYGGGGSSDTYAITGEVPASTFAPMSVVVR